MSFWNTSSGEDVTDNVAKEYDAGGGDFELIPDGSSVLAVIDQAGWTKDQAFNEYINLRWSIVEPESLTNRKVFQKLWVKDAEPRALEKGKDKADAKRDKALRMLATIDANCGGKLARNGEEPDDDRLMLSLANKPMVIKVKVWEMNDNSGNWIAAVSPKGSELKLGESVSKKVDKNMDDLGDQIPF